MTSLVEAIGRAFPPDLKSEVGRYCCHPLEENKGVLSDEQLIALMCDSESISNAVGSVDNSSRAYEEQRRLLQEAQLQIYRMF